MKLTLILKSAINIVLSIIMFFLGLRLLLKLFVANTAAPFVAWIYATSEPLLYPFRGMFASPVLEDGVIIEFSTMFAMIAYALLAWIVNELISLSSNVSRKNSDDSDDRDERDDEIVKVKERTYKKK